MKIKINITIDEEVLKRIESKRGLVPLSTYINAGLRDYLKIRG